MMNSIQFKKKKTAIAVLAILSPLMTNLAYAEEKAKQETEVIVVTGIKGSLVQSLNNKRFSESVYDGISAEDIGKFPDQNVAESLQRITGVSIDRSSGEGTTVSIRGFGPEFNTVTLNNRTVPTDNGGRGFSFDLLASELISGADVYKTSQASRVEGSIGGLVNVKTARPFDLDGFKAVGSIKGVHDTLVSDTSPSASLFIGQNFDDKFGLLASFSYLQRDARADSISVGGWREDTVITSNDPADSANKIQAYRPQSAEQVLETQDRERIGATLTAQWSPVDDVLVTGDFLYSALEVEDRNSSLSRWFSNPIFNANVDENGTVNSLSRVPKPLVSQGVFQLWENGNRLGTGQWNSSSQNSDSRDVETTTLGINVEWNVDDNLVIELDAHKSSTSGRSGNNARVALSNPTQDVTNFALSDDGFQWNGPEKDFIGNPSDYYPNNVQFTSDDRDDDITEVKLDAHWQLDDMGILDSIKTGFSYSDREKIANNGETSWGTVVTAFNGFRYNPPASVLSLTSPKGGFLSDYGGLVNNFYTYDVQDLVDFLSDPNGGVREQAVNVGHQIINNFENGDPTYSTLAEAQTAADAATANALAKIDAAQAFMPEGQSGNSLGIFSPLHRVDKSWRVGEETIAYYLEANLVGEAWSGNVGVRYVETETTSFGNGTEIVNITYNSAIGDGPLNTASGKDISANAKYDKFLPSLNFRWNVSEDIVARMGWSQTLTRPQLSQLTPNQDYKGKETANSQGIPEFDGTITGSNVELKPYLATNFDLSLEYYYADDSTIALAYFNKSIKDWIAQGNSQRTLSLPYIVDGVSQGNKDFVFDASLPINVEDSDATGIELSVLHAFDNGFGVQANYTYMDSDSEAVPGEEVQGALTGLSKNAYNVIAFYEEGDIQARIAYNWRSEYLSCTSCLRGEPITVEDYGQLDMSASYTINENFEVFVEGVNVTDEDRREYSRFSSRFVSLQDTGARFSVGLRGQF
ncbi:TonB-dependent receptor [Pseudocolwellia agarivorans]|uniref:TonB-dependent receptor n=1 Tax=Pseudocolwellia agarivorans TaxID=1911682 RepID=UPI000985B823|nr:TonB-dependent receptor [Pseudocolwellia agarivorans]